MDFAFSEEQEMLRKQARRYLDDAFSPERVAELAESDPGWDRDSWKQVAELGWLGLSVPEDAGGAGMGFLEEAVILEETGYALFPGPFFSTVVLAQPALQFAPEHLKEVIAGDRTATLVGNNGLTPDADAAEFFVFASEGGEPSLVVASRDEVEIEPLSTMDRTRRYGRVSLGPSQGQSLVEGADAAEVVRQIRLRGLAGLAVESVGVAQKVLDLSQEHTKERAQFDKPIGSFQAVSHQVADTYVGVELARSLAYWAVWCVAESDPQAPQAAAAAKATAAEVAVEACERSIQVHGGIGFTWEHVLHRYYKRAQWIESFGGYPAAHRAEVADLLLS
jgi:alkylation response protein AidB-like acyl-CoA dehydrogenase